MKNLNDSTVRTVLKGFRIYFSAPKITEESPFGRVYFRVRFYNYDAEEYWEFKASDLEEFIGKLLDKVVESERNSAKWELQRDLKRLLDV